MSRAKTFHTEHKNERARAIERVRKALDLTGEQMAKLMSVSVSGYWSWTSGRRIPKANRVDHAAQLMGKTFSEIVP